MVVLGFNVAGDFAFAFFATFDPEVATTPQIAKDTEHSHNEPGQAARTRSVQPVLVLGVGRPIAQKQLRGRALNRGGGSGRPNPSLLRGHFAKGCDATYGEWSVVALWLRLHPPMCHQ